MGMAAKVLWGEGLFLRPQHFQRQDQYHEARLHHTASALHPYLWGVAQLQWDLAALQTGTLRLLALSAIFRDGEVFEALGDGAPGSDTLPPPVDLEALPPAVQEVTYYAALPILNREGMNYTAQASTAGTPAATRFAHAMRATPDLFTESAVADVAYLKKTVRLSKKYHAHDEKNEAKTGDVVRIEETRPLSKQKRWALVEKVVAGQA